jgi:class 3 adenylate cyclase
VAALSTKARAALPDSAFAWIDSSGRRRLPIHDEAHVRNALARFSRTPFESPEARERARKRLLQAAKKHGIVPIGFIDRQLRNARDGDTSDLPRGVVTFLRTDIEGSTQLVERLDGRYGDVLDQARDIIKRSVSEADGCEVDCRADEYFAAFSSAPHALKAAIDIQRRFASATWPDNVQVRVRIGLHTGRPVLRKTGYIGVDVPTVARVTAVGHGGQILASAPAYEALIAIRPADVRFRPLGTHRLRGLNEPVKLYQVEAEGLATDFAPLRLDVPAAAAQTHGAKAWEAWISR